MLFQLLNRLAARINKLDVKEEAPRFAAQLRKMRPSLKTELMATGVAKGQIDNVLLALSAAHLGIIKGIPAIGGEMSKVIQAGSADPSFRCLLAGTLAYLVQPHDLLPDDLPGGYGFIDDALLLHEACALSWEVTGDMARAAEKRKIFQLVYTAVPDESRELFQSAISGMAMTLSLMRSLDPIVAEMTTQSLIANPLQPIGPQGQAGAGGRVSSLGSQFTGYQGAPGPQYSWTDGNTIGVNFPGGGGVVSDGRDIFVT